MSDTKRPVSNGPNPPAPAPQGTGFVPQYPRGPYAAPPSGPMPVPAGPMVPNAAPSGPAVPLVQQGPLPGPVAGPMAGPMGGSMPSGAPQPQRLTVQYPQRGSTLVSPRGSYEITRVLGAGEFGAVYEAMGPFDQIYAVKMVRPANRPYAEVHAEWAREQSRLNVLRHPNIVYIHDAFEQNHLFYIALEKCDHALTDMLGTVMREGLVCELARQLLAAVQFLHDNDVVHDDLHGGNVLISHTDDRPVVKISDFGISHELRGKPAIRPNVVHHAIMAPEILATGYTSKQSDLYQIGLLLYWMLTGEPAIPKDAPYNELVRIVSEGLPRARAEALGTPFGMLIAKMLRRREAFRYTSAREVWADMRELPAWKNRELFPVK